jgi:hypothetical protein
MENAAESDDIAAAHRAGDFEIPAFVDAVAIWSCAVEVLPHRDGAKWGSNLRFAIACFDPVAI